MSVESTRSQNSSGLRRHLAVHQPLQASHLCVRTSPIAGCSARIRGG